MMKFVTELGGVKFIEGADCNFTPIQKLDTTLNSAFGQDQLKSLTDVKLAMAKQVVQLGGNCLVNFKYGQKVGGFWSQLLSLDDVMWYGSGVVGTLDE
jgi:hypothetical protein